MAMMRGSSGYSPGRFALELDGRKPVGVLTAVEGASFKAEAIGNQVGLGSLVSKYPGKPKFDEFTITCGMAMSHDFWIWIKNSLESKPTRKNGAIVSYDAAGKERTRRTFTNALITEVQFPSLEAAQAGPALLKVKIVPETLTFTPGDGSTIPHDQALNEMTKAKPWHVNNFTFRLDRFGTTNLPTAAVAGFTVKQNVIDNPVGYSLTNRKEVGRLELPTFQVTFNEADVARWMSWYDLSVTKGNFLDQETTGHLTYLQTTEDLKQELMRLELFHVALLNVDFGGYEAGKKGVSRVQVTLSSEMLRFVPGQGIVT